MVKVVERSAGRSTFGVEAARYDWARPPYPEALFDLLRRECGLKPGCRTFEVGAGTGIATRRLLEFGAGPLVAIEPDARMATQLQNTTPHAALEIVNATFEDVKLDDGAFDLGVSATAFHWLDQAPSLAKAHRLLRPGGWWTMCWNTYGNPEIRTDFDRATRHLFDVTPDSPSRGTGGAPFFALNVQERTADLAAAGFTGIGHEIVHTAFTFETERLVALYGSFSVVHHLPSEDRAKFLSDLTALVDRDFGGKVERPLTTSIYFGRKP
ncbi:MAG: methyltransferase domain-containing protein [Alphaproteobacteria bacterium]|nr:methyltransferase domain-containing protein [Alphaproteobacteria bacterium]